MTVYLFKGKNSDDQEDAYEHQLKSHGYDVKFIPTLSHNAESVQQLGDLIVAGPDNQHIGGVIFCSQRAVETWREAAAATSLTVTDDTRAAWRCVPALVVGPKTAEQLERLEFFNDRTQWVVANRASELADNIQSTSYCQQRQQLLFLAGDKRRDELPMRLAQMNIPVKEIRAYRTCAHPDLARAVEDLKCQLGADDWIVFFSPSGVKYIQQITTSVFERAKIGSIGPTTTDYICSQNYPVRATAQQPKADCLAVSLADYDAKNKRTGVI